jgi:hypothetical protein
MLSILFSFQSTIPHSIGIFVFSFLPNDHFYCCAVPSVWHYWILYSLVVMAAALELWLLHHVLVCLVIDKHLNSTCRITIIVLSKLLSVWYSSFPICSKDRTWVYSFGANYMVTTINASLETRTRTVVLYWFVMAISCPYTRSGESACNILAFCQCLFKLEQAQVDLRRAVLRQQLMPYPTPTHSTPTQLLI